MKDAISNVFSKFEDPYQKVDEEHRFHVKFYKAIADAGWLGICMPSRYGGADLALSETSVMMQTIVQSGAGFAGVSSIHMNIFGLEPVRNFGSEEQKQRMFVPLINGKERACLELLNGIRDLIRRSCKVLPRRVEMTIYILKGSKISISTARVAEKILILVCSTL